MIRPNPPRRATCVPRRIALPRGQSLVELTLILPIILVLFVAVADFARLYTTMTTIEAAAREAADFGAFDSQYWTDPDGTSTGMIHRACMASSNLPDYVGTKDDVAATCTNPSVATSLRDGGNPSLPGDPEACANRDNPSPCWVSADLRYTFHLILPLSFRLFDVEIGFPSTITFDRTSTFAISDLQLESQSPPPDTTPAPTPTPAPEDTPTPAPEDSGAPSVEPSPPPSEVTP